MAQTTSFVTTHYGSLLALHEFCTALPKAELHAHVNGSISPDTMRVLVEQKKDAKPHLAEFRIPDKLEDITDFFPIFKFIYQLTDNEESVRFVVRSVIGEFATDGVRYLELRTTPRRCDETGMTKESYVRAVIETMRECESAERIVVRLILSIDRKNTLEEAMEVVVLALKFKEEGVVGVDLCGNVMVGSFDELKPAFVKAKEAGLKITLHFGEVPSNVPESPSLLSVHPDRLGHATILDDVSRTEIYARNLPIELCMTSNVLCRTVKDYSEHYIRGLLQQGHPFVLCTDDKGVFMCSLSSEYAIAASMFSLTKAQVFEASLRSIDMIFADDKVKDELKRVWGEWWQGYSKDVVVG